MSDLDPYNPNEKLNNNPEPSNSVNIHDQHDQDEDDSSAYEFQENNKDSKSKLRNYLSSGYTKMFIWVFFSDVIYMSSKKDCASQEPNNCQDDFVESNLIHWILMIITFVFCQFNALHISLTNKNVSPLVGIILLPINLYFCFRNWNLNKFDVHRLLHLITIVALLVTLLFYSFIMIARSLKRRNRKYYRIYMIGSALLLALFIYKKIFRSCDVWEKGLYSEIQHSDEYCSVTVPWICPYYVFDGLQDYSLGATCDNQIDTFEQLNKYFPTNGNYIVYPDTKLFEPLERIVYFNSIQKATIKRLFTVDSLDDPRLTGHNEFFIDIRDHQHPEVIVKVQRNETLVKEREQIKIDNNKEEKILDNIILLYVDAIGRPEYHLKMQHTMKWVKDFVERKNGEYEFNEFYRYHSVAMYTVQNMHHIAHGFLPQRYLDEGEEHKYDNFTRVHHFIKSFQDNGFITARTADYYELSPMFINNVSLSQVYDDPFDHEGMVYTTDPNYLDPKLAHPRFEGAFGCLRRCLYGKDMIDYSTEYAVQFWEQYQDQNKFLYFDLIDAHEGTMEAMKYADPKIPELFNKLEDLGAFNEKTGVIFLSDHGQHMSGGYQSTDQYNFEASLPVFFMLLPTSMDKDIRESIAGNQQKLVYANDIHDTFLTLAKGKDSENFEKSVLNSNLPSDRTCKDIPSYHIHHCSCV